MEGTNMGVPIVLWDGFEVVPPPEINDVIIFGSEKTVSNCGESTVTTEEDGTVFSGESSPGGVAEEEWPEAKSFSFYFVKHRVYDDPEIKAKIDEADQEIYRCNKRRIYVSNAQKSKRAEISSLSAQIKSLVPKSQEYRLIFEEKKREFDTLLEALRRLPCSSSDQLCFSKEELDHLIYHAHYQIEHGSLGFEGEGWLVKDIEKPDGIILSEDSLAQKEASINRVKSIAMELHAVKKELDAITWNINHVTEKLGKIQNNVRVLDIEMAHILEERDKSYERIKKLRIQRDKGNAAFFQSLTVMRKAKELAACRNVRDLEVFASSEVDRFMTHWNDDKAFRDDYVKRLSLSLCERQLDQDGRIKNPEVQAVWEKQVPKTMMAGENVHKTNREDSSSNSSQDGNVITDEQRKDMMKKSMDINRSSAEESDVIDMESPQKEEEEEVDEETLKERKREEQIEKARLAMERKRKLQEKAAAKAAIRAQKEAEKKLKECAKKAKKKAAANSSSPSEPDQSREVVTELETVKTVTVSGNEKHLRERSLFPKQKGFRHKHRRGGTEALPKAILNRRRAHKYWVWGLSSAAFACALILVVVLIQVTGKGKGLALPDQI